MIYCPECQPDLAGSLLTPLLCCDCVERLKGMNEIVTPIIVTRGDVDLSEILETMLGPGVRPLTEYQVAKPVIWNNARAGVDLQTFGTFAAMAVVETNLVYFQDDDVVVEHWPALLDQWHEGAIICNMAPDFQDAYAGQRDKLIGHGGVFDIELVKPTFERYLKHYPLDALLRREANRIFTGLNFDRCKMVYVGHRNLPWASGGDRLWKQTDHGEKHREATRRVEYILQQEGRL